MWSWGATGDRSNAVDVAISFSEDLLRGQVSKNLPVLKLSGMLG